jgi:hypothetical protein
MQIRKALSSPPFGGWNEKWKQLGKDDYRTEAGLLLDRERGV